MFNRYHSILTGDFQKWVELILGDRELAKRIDGIPKNTSEVILHEKLRQIVQKRVSELQLAH
jgi:hypothetical protein